MVYQTEKQIAEAKTSSRPKTSQKIGGRAEGGAERDRAADGTPFGRAACARFALRASFQLASIFGDVFGRELVLRFGDLFFRLVDHRTELVSPVPTAFATRLVFGLVLGGLFTMPGSSCSLSRSPLRCASARLSGREVLRRTCKMPFASMSNVTSISDAARRA